MLEILIISFVTLLVNYLIKVVAKHLISKSETAATSVKIRKIFRFARLCLILLYTVIILPELYFVIPKFFENSKSYYWSLRMVFIIIAISSLPYASMSLPVSGMTIESLKDNDFALYLRGFSSDSYEASSLNTLSKFYDRATKIKREKPVDVMSLPFSEHDFAKAIKQFMPIYCVGMTKEIESPEGCKRIYLNDEDWQEGVKLLIEKAKIVFILVNPSESCIWEVLKSQEIATDKTIFFVDNPDYIDILKQKMEYNSIPKCIRHFTGKHTYNYAIDEQCYSYAYTNNELGFVNVLGVYLEDKELAQIKKNQQSHENFTNQCDHSRYVPH